MTELFPILFGLMILFGSVYFYLIIKIFKSLEKRHPNKFDSLGRPGLFSNNTPANNLLFLKFLFKRNWKDLNDEKIASLGNSSLIVFVVYSCIFLAMILDMFSAITQ